MPAVRYWGDVRPLGFDAWLKLPDQALRERYAGIMRRRHAYLVVAGGGIGLPLVAVAPKMPAGVRRNLTRRGIVPRSFMFQLGWIRLGGERTIYPVAPCIPGGSREKP